MGETAARAPDWDHLFETAAAQDGLFTTKQAAEAGYSPQLLAHHLGGGRMVRVRRGSTGSCTSQPASTRI